MSEQPTPDELAALKGWLRDSGAPAPHRPHSSVEMAQARAEIEAERVDDLAEALASARVVADRPEGRHVLAPDYMRLLLAEFDRLRLVEQAATTLVEQVWDEETQTFCCFNHLRSGLDALAAAVRGETL